MVRPIIIFILFGLIFSGPLCGQVLLEGQVSDKETGEPLAGATVMVLPQKEAAITDQQGYYELEFTAPAEAIRVSYIGYQTRRLSLRDTSGRVDFQLDPREHSIREVVVKGESGRPGSSLFHRSRLSTQGLEQEGSFSSASVYQKLEAMPGVMVESQDITGLSEKTVRIRGVKSYFSGMTLEGIPNYGVMPIGPRDYLYDMENIQALSLYKGAIPADVFSATGNKGGVMRLKMEGPRKDFGVMARQSVGSHAFARSFVRIDAGRLPSGTALFGSYSFTRADKWKGAGRVGPRHNFTVNLDQQLSDQLGVEVVLMHNRMKRHNFRELTYDQASNISDHYRLDFIESAPSSAFEKAHFYDNNKGRFINTLVFGSMDYRPDSSVSMNVKPYYAEEDAGMWHKRVTGPPSDPGYRLFNRHRNTRKAGLVSKNSLQWGKLNVSLGYWFEVNDLEARVHQYALISDQQRQDLGIHPLTKNKTPGFIHNPYIRLSGSHGDWNWHGGLKYFYYQRAETENFSVTPEDKAPLPSMNLHHVDYSAWLPTAGLGYDITPGFELSLSYGRNYMRPYMYGPTRSLYLRNRESFLEAGISFEDIMQGWEMETSDQLNIRARWRGKGFDLSASPFMAWHHHVLTPVWDKRVEAAYPRDVGNVKAYGVEGKGRWTTPWNLTFMLNATWMHMAYQENIVAAGAGSPTTLHIQGNQTPSVPEVYGLAGLQYRWRKLLFSLRWRHVGVRYGDATNKEKISGYHQLSLKGAFSFSPDWARQIKLSLQVRNVLNTPYVGRMVAMDYEGSGAPDYYAGMPRAMALTLTAAF